MCLAIPGQIVEMMDVSRHLARVEIGGVTRTINIGLLNDPTDPGGAVALGDWVLVHVGFAMSKVDEEEAQATLRLLREMGPEFEEEIAEIRESRGP